MNQLHSMENQSIFLLDLLRLLFVHVFCSVIMHNPMFFLLFLFALVLAMICISSQNPLHRTMRNGQGVSLASKVDFWEFKAGYHGFHLLQLSATTPDDSERMWWDGKKITRNQLIQLLRFEIDAYSLLRRIDGGTESPNAQPTPST